MEGTDARERDEHDNEVVRDDEAVEETPEEEVGEATPEEKYGQIVHFKRELDEGDWTKLRDASIVIGPGNVIIKNRQGADGVEATPELLEAAEVVE